MSKADRYAEREWLSQPRPKPAFEPYSRGPGNKLDIVEFTRELEEVARVYSMPLGVETPMVEHVTLFTPEWPGALTAHVTEHAPATPEFLATMQAVRS